MLESIQSFFSSQLGGIVLGILLILISWLIAWVVRWIFNKGLKKTPLSRKLAEWGVVRSEASADNIVNIIGQIAYAVIWILFLPSILNAFGLVSLAEPIKNMIAAVVGFIPKLLLVAVYILLGVLVAKVVKHLVYNLALGLNIDKWTKKLRISDEGSSDSDSQNSSKSSSLAKVLGNVVFVLVLIPFLIPALEALELQSITNPIVNVFNSILQAIPNILVAAILIFVGYILAKIVLNILKGLLENTGINKINKYLSDDGSINVNFANVISIIVAAVLFVFFIVEALNSLNLEVLSMIGNAIIAYLPNILAALIILLLGLVGGAALARFIKNSMGSKLFAYLVQGGLAIFAIFMALNQLGFATQIVNIAFVLILGAAAVAFALAFGLGGRDFANKQLQKLDKHVGEEAEKVKSVVNEKDSENSDEK